MAQISLTLARRFSSTAGTNQLVKAPIQLFGIDGRYAHALYSAASKEKQLEAVEKDLKELSGLIKKKGPFADFLLNPSLKRSGKKDLMLSAMGKTKASKLTGNLLGLLAENGRLGKFENIISAFATIMSAHRGEVICHVVTAKPLDAALQQELDAALKSFVKSGQSILMTSSVDPAILGGLIVSIGDKYVDMSTASKIKKYTQIIQTAI
jgi:F-type H+-transporting ATPase subunit O